MARIVYIFFPLILLVLPAVIGSSDVQLFQDFKLTILRAETNKHRTGKKVSDEPIIPNLFLQLYLVAKRWDGRDIGHESFYAKTKVIHSGKPFFNETFYYLKGVSPGFVMGTDTVMRVNLYDHMEEKEEWLGRFEIHLGHEANNDRSKMEMMNVVQNGVVGSAIWYEYEFTIFKTIGGLWGSDVSSNWNGNSEEAEADNDYGK